ncbi:MAG: YdeI/OmpD-associated family protein [Candidatus Marinimicrobia bacterium]|nr:YdeI/OmpD-associated family protein [Candidatus Neomarinimicrobiota bacterium]
MKKFKTKLISYDISGAWTFLTVPFSVEKEYGTKAQVKVKGTIDGISYKSTLLPLGDGKHNLVVKKEIRNKIGKEAGDIVSVTLEKDTAKRVVKAPQDLRDAMTKKASEFFDGLAPSYKKAYVEWIESAKKEETRQRRIAKAVDMLSGGKKLK